MKKKTKFKDWLKAQGLTCSKFTEGVNAELSRRKLGMRIDHGAAQHWSAERRHPNANTQALIKLAYADCPLVEQK